MADSTDLSQYQAQLGTVIHKDMAQIRSRMFMPTVSMQHCRTVMGIQDGQIYTANTARISEVSQGWQEGYTPKGGATFEPSQIVQRRHKVDFDFAPDKFVGEWLGHLTNEKDLDRRNWPISRYAIFNLLLPKMTEERELMKFYKGVYAAPTPGTPTTAVAAVDGIGKIIEDGLVSNSMHRLDVNALSEATVYDQINDAVKMIPEYYRFNVPMKLYLSQAHYENYLDGWEETNGLKVSTRDTNKSFVKGTQIQFAPLPSMVGSNRFFITTPQNMVRIVDRVTDKGTMDVEKAKRILNIMADWHEAFGFDYHKLVWANTFTTGATAETEDFTGTFQSVD